jgi:predicted transglutaminase-like cysteine proteinase
MGWLMGRIVGGLAAMVLVGALAVSVRAGLMDISAGLKAYIDQRWGVAATTRVAVWQRLMRDNQPAQKPNLSDAEALKLTNDFFNQVPYVSDLQHWGVKDYWATPIEMLGSLGGDCEDYAIAKYLTLKALGIPIEKMRITYVRALVQQVPHMVLAYYPTPDADPLILDNLNGTIRPASQRPDLVPVYSFNDDDLWLPGYAERKGGASNVRLWREVREKLAKEQRL